MKTEFKKTGCVSTQGIEYEAKIEGLSVYPWIIYIPKEILSVATEKLVLPEKIRIEVEAGGFNDG